MGESAISVRNVKIKYRCFKKVSLLKSIFAPRKNKKIEYFEAVKGVSFEVEKGQILGIVGKTAAVNLHFLRQSQAFFHLMRAKSTFTVIRFPCFLSA